MQNLRNRETGNFEGNQFIIQHNTNLEKDRLRLTSVVNTDDKSRTISNFTDQKGSYVKAGAEGQLLDGDNYDNQSQHSY